MEPGRLADQYDSHYYQTYLGSVPYTREEPSWPHFFGGVADGIIRGIDPRTVLDAGCAIGLLVECLRDRGVEAYGFDISEFAISQVREDLRNCFWVGSLTDRLPRSYDLITCIEVLEHLPRHEVDAAIANLCAHTDDIIFSSTPDDYAESTHLNVRPFDYWVEMFARSDFYPDAGFDAGFITPWAVRFRRRRDPFPRLAARYERELQRLRTEADARDKVVLQQRTQIGSLTSEVRHLRADLDGSTVGRIIADSERLEAELERTEKALIEAERIRAQLANENEAFRALTAGVTWRAAEAARRSVRRVFPADTRRGRRLSTVVGATSLVITDGIRGWRAHVHNRAVEALTRVVDGGDAYTAHELEYLRWCEENDPTPETLETMRQEAGGWEDRPTLSIIMPVFNSEAKWLEDAIDSVLAQTYDRWELCIADDASTLAHVGEVLARYAALDARIRVVRRDHNGGIVAASNTALSLASGELVGLLDHDDILLPHAVHTMVARFREEPATGLAYSDEDKLLVNGARGQPFFKPDWSPSMLLSSNFICHFAVLRRPLVDAVGGFREGFDGSQDYDLFLRVVDTGCQVAHVAAMLYSWRQAPGSAALSPAAKPYAYVAARKALEDTLTRRGKSGRVESSPHIGWYYVRPNPPASATVTIAVPTRDRLDVLQPCISSLEQVTAWANFSVLIIDNDSKDPETLAYLEASPHTVLRHPGIHNRSRMVNAAVANSDSEYVVVLDSELIARSAEWMEAMLEQCAEPDVGAVGGRVFHAEGQPLHEGMALGYAGDVAASLDYGGYFALGDAIHEVAAVSGACMMFRRQVFDEMGGFDNRMRVAYADVDFCLRLAQHGYRVIYTPLAEFTRGGSTFHGQLRRFEDEAQFRERWGDAASVRDPYVNPAIASFSPLRLRLRQPGLGR